MSEEPTVSKAVRAIPLIVEKLKETESALKKAQSDLKLVRSDLELMKTALQDLATRGAKKAEAMSGVPPNGLHPFKVCG